MRYDLCKFCGKRIMLCIDSHSGSMLTLDVDASVYAIEENRFSDISLAKLAVTVEGDRVAHVLHSSVCKESGKSFDLPMGGHDAD